MESHSNVPPKGGHRNDPEGDHRNDPEGGHRNDPEGDHRNSSDPAADGELQFDRADFGEAAPSAALQCASCNQAISDAYYEVNGVVACEACQAKAQTQRAGGSAVARVAWASLFGILAGAAGAGIYYGISALTGYEFGLIAILVGFMVGFAVNFGSQQRGGWFYQLLAVALTYGSIVATYVPQIAEGFREMAMEEKLAEASEPQTGQAAGALAATNGETAGLFAEDPVSGDDPERSSSASTEVMLEHDDEALTSSAGSVETAGELEELQLPGIFFWIFVVLLAFVAPFLGGFENILGILIIGFGLWEAWRLNRRQPFEISGPFQVADARAGS